MKPKLKTPVSHFLSYAIIFKKFTGNCKIVLLRVPILIASVFNGHLDKTPFTQFSIFLKKLSKYITI